MYRKPSITVYHGTIYDIKKVDVSKGRPRKDFGRGFYMALSPRQAIGMMHAKYKAELNMIHTKYKAELNMNQDAKIQEHLYEIHLDKEVMESLNIKRFDTADMEWLDFVLMCRNNPEASHSFDMVIGPTADDATALSLGMYERGAYGEIGSLKAKLQLLEMLEPENLGTQYFIGKQDIADKVILSMYEVNWRYL